MELYTPTIYFHVFFEVGFDKRLNLSIEFAAEVKSMLLLEYLK